MKTIIAPVDFSANSANALAFAAELAKRAAAQLVILHAYQSKKEESAAGQKLQTLVNQLKETFGAALNCEISLVSGSLATVMKRAIDAQRADLIVMGTKGATGLKRILVGSNTVNVIAKTKLPVLVIPEDALFKNFLKKGKNRIVLATDLVLLKNEQALNILKEIALMIVDPKVRVLNVRPKDTGLTPVARMERDSLLSLFNPEIESERITVFSNNVIDGINFYLRKNADTGVVAMIARDTGYLIQRHFTRKMASYTQLPLLVLHDVK